jgi:HEAT repeat protein
MREKLGVAAVCAALSWAMNVGAQPPPATTAPPGSPVLLATSETAPAAKPSLAPPRPVAAKASDKAERAAALKGATNQLESFDPAVIETGFGTLAKLGGRDAAEPVIARLRRGLPPQLIDAALDALVTLKQPVAVPALLELTTHRRWQVREQALDALGALQARSAQSALLYALDDPSAEVREASARALARVGDGRASAALLTAHERGVKGALVALGTIGGQREAELLGKRAQTECAAMTPALLAMLQRPNQFSALKLRAVAVLASAKTSESTQCLNGLLSGLAADADPRLRSVLAKAAGAAPPAAPGAARPAAPPAGAPAAAPAAPPARPAAAPATAGVQP